MARKHSEETKRKISDSMKARNRLKSETAVRKKLADGFERGSGKSVSIVQNQSSTSISYLAELQERTDIRVQAAAELDNKDTLRKRRKRDFGLATQKPVASG